MNKKPFQYIGHCGTEFTCDNCELSKPILVKSYASSPNQLNFLLRDVAEMTGWHAVNIRPELNGFSGYDCIEFKFEN